jgi:RNA polymerase sigma-70 factor (ECF subfamily)
LNKKDKLETKEDLEKIFREHSNLVFRVILFKIGMNKESAQDLTQETFIRAWKYKSSFNSDKSQLKTWLVKIAKNICIDYQKKQKPVLDVADFEEVIASKESTEDIGAKSIMKEKILIKLNDLSESDREILTLRYIEEFDLKEIAQSLGKPYFIVKVSANRAFKRLQKLFENE